MGRRPSDSFGGGAVPPWRSGRSGRSGECLPGETPQSLRRANVILYWERYYPQRWSGAPRLVMYIRERSRTRPSPRCLCSASGRSAEEARVGSWTDTDAADAPSVVESWRVPNPAPGTRSAAPAFDLDGESAGTGSRRWDPALVTIRLGRSWIAQRPLEAAPEGIGGQRFAMWIVADDHDAALNSAPRASGRRRTRRSASGRAHGPWFVGRWKRGGRSAHASGHVGRRPLRHIGEHSPTTAPWFARSLVEGHAGTEVARPSLAAPTCALDERVTELRLSVPETGKRFLPPPDRGMARYGRRPSARDDRQRRSRPRAKAAGPSLLPERRRARSLTEVVASGIKKLEVQPPPPEAAGVP